jgi:hypothetical protein
VFSNRNFKKRSSQTIYIMRFGLKLHLLSPKLQSQTHPTLQIQLGMSSIHA